MFDNEKTPDFEIVVQTNDLVAIRATDKTQRSLTNSAERVMGVLFSRLLTENSLLTRLPDNVYYQDTCGTWDQMLFRKTDNEFNPVRFTKFKAGTPEVRLALKILLEGK